MTVLADLVAERYCAFCEQSFVTAALECPDDGTRLVSLAPLPDPLIGRDLDDRYMILERLAVGGMGAVYRAQQHSVDREVALKVVRPSLVGDPETIKRFLREAKLASQLAHPNSVAVLDFGQTADGMFYLVMELIAGRTLDEVLLEDGVFDARRLVRIGAQVCDALDAAQAMSIVHRDLKPANIILLDNSRDLVKVLDFGLAKSLEHDVSMTRTGGMCGTPAFLPPERACGQPGDHRSDLYALGCVLYLLGSGRLPFTSDSVPDLLRMQVCEPPPRMSGVPVALAEVIERLLAKDPADRYQSASALREALEAALPVTQVHVIPPSWRRPPTTLGSETVESVPLLAEARPRGTAASPAHAPTAHAPASSPAPHAPASSPAHPAHPAHAPTAHARGRGTPARRWWIAGTLAGLTGMAVLAPDAAQPEAAPTISAPPPSPFALELQVSTKILEARVDDPAPATPIAPSARPRPRRPRLPF